MIKGPEAWERFRAAIKTIVAVPKSVLPPMPCGGLSDFEIRVDPCILSTAWKI